jgi:chloramphenicol 3-O phosphotransferase
MIILLNGASSSGKTTLARALQAKWDSPLLHLGIDTTIGMLPAAYVGMGPRSCEGFEFYYDADDRGPVVRVRSGPVARKLGASIARTVALLAAEGHDLVLDYVILETKDLVPFLQELGPFRVYFVGVRCDLGTLEARELSRGDRMLNLARPQHGAVHAPPRPLRFGGRHNGAQSLRPRDEHHRAHSSQPPARLLQQAAWGAGSDRDAPHADGLHNRPSS